VYRPKGDDYQDEYCPSCGSEMASGYKLGRYGPRDLGGYKCLGCSMVWALVEYIGEEPDWEGWPDDPRARTDNN
jgi:hypothetical protein